jgi:argininosuccinate lyase
LASALVAFVPHLAKAREAHDEYFSLRQMNKAANVVLLENGVIDAATARGNAGAIRRVDADMAARRSGDYKLVEPLLIAKGGYDVSTLHSGRSRVDIVATSRRLLQREQILQASEALNAARRSILEFGEAHKRGLVPLHTQGRRSAAVPTDHYVGAYLRPSTSRRRTSGRPMPR